MNAAIEATGVLRSQKANILFCLGFMVALVGMGLLFVTLMRFELAAKSTKAQISRLRRALDAEAPAGSSSRIAPTAPAEAGAR